MTTIVVKRPRDPQEIKALIRERKRNVAKLERALKCPLPAQDRRHLTLRLSGERNNLRSWETYLAKIAAK